MPYLTFRHTRQLDNARRLAEKRDDVYVDALAEFVADVNWLRQDLDTRLHGAPADYAQPDTRLPAAERTRLGARMMAFAAPAVLQALDQSHEALLQCSRRTHDEGSFNGTWVELDRALSDFQDAVRGASAG